MKAIKVTCQNGCSWTTSINGTIESIKHYFIGKLFNTGSYPLEEMSKAVKVEELKKPDKMYIVQGWGTGIGWNDCSKPLNAIDADARRLNMYENGMMPGTQARNTIDEVTRIVPVEDANCKY